IKRTTNFTGALSSASNSIPLVDLPKAATTSSSRSDEQFGMAMPNPLPVLIVSSRCLRDARMLSRSALLILPSPTSRSINSTIAGQRSVAFISGMICSAESRLANDMQNPPWERKLNVRIWVDKRDLAESGAPDLFVFSCASDENPTDGSLRLCSVQAPIRPYGTNERSHLHSRHR